MRHLAFLTALFLLPLAAAAEEPVYNNINGELYRIIPLEEYLAEHPELVENTDFNSLKGERILGFAESQIRTGWLTSKISYMCWLEKCNPIGTPVTTVSDKKFTYMIEAGNMDDWEFIIQVLKSDGRVRLVMPVILDGEMGEEH